MKLYISKDDEIDSILSRTYSGGTLPGSIAFDVEALAADAKKFLTRQKRKMMALVHPDMKNTPEAKARATTEFQQLNEEFEPLDDDVWIQSVQGYARALLVNPDEDLQSYQLHFAIVYVLIPIWKEEMARGNNSSDMEIPDGHKWTAQNVGNGVVKRYYTTPSGLNILFPNFTSDIHMLLRGHQKNWPKENQRRIDAEAATWMLSSAPNFMSRKRKRRRVEEEPTVEEPRPTVNIAPPAPVVQTPTVAVTPPVGTTTFSATPPVFSMGRTPLSAGRRRGPYKKRSLYALQAQCPSCRRYPEGIGCWRHLNPQQIANKNNGVVFGQNKDTREACGNCIAHGDYCLTHAYQRGWQHFHASYNWTYIINNNNKMYGNVNNNNMYSNVNNNINNNNMHGNVYYNRGAEPMDIDGTV